jgi:hypothetical protein
VTDPAQPRPIPGPPRPVPGPVPGASTRPVPDPGAAPAGDDGASPGAPVPESSRFADLAERSVAEHVAVYEAEHERLQRELSTIDQL